MYNVKSSPFYTIETSSAYSNYSQNEHSYTSSEESYEAPTPVATDAQSMNSRKGRPRSSTTRTSLVVYGPICIRKRHTPAPTLATGRRSKDDLATGEDLDKREKRRVKNREAARNLKILRDNIENELQTKVSQLEVEEKTLLTDIDNLQMYKDYLEDRCKNLEPVYEYISRTESTVLYQFKQQQQQTEEHNETKEEPRSPSPQWQLMFSI